MVRRDEHQEGFSLNWETFEDGVGMFATDSSVSRHVQVGREDAGVKKE